MTYAAPFTALFSPRSFLLGTIVFLAVAAGASATFFHFFFVVLLLFVWAYGPALLIFGLALDLLGNVSTSDNILPKRLVSLSASLGFVWLPFLAFAVYTLTHLTGGSG